jgi:AraC family transcriptional regulator
MMNSPAPNVVPFFDPSISRLLQPAVLLPLQAPTVFARRNYSSALSNAQFPAGRTAGTVEFSPNDAVQRRTVSFEGVTVEIVQATKLQRMEASFCAPRHLLVVHEQGARRDGESFVEGLPKSMLRDFKRKLTFVPADHEYYEWQEPRSLARVAYFYFDPAHMPTQPQTRGAALAARMFFEDAALSETTGKLIRLIESTGGDNRLYLQALGAVLAHELMRPTEQRNEAPARGGLAGWQQHIVTAYIEEHVADQIPLAALAELIRLSPYYFCRAFKQSFGLPPHRYHTKRRIEHAKALLARPAPSVTEIGMRVGFSDTSSFTTAFRKATGLTPTAYHRSLS